MDDEIFSLIFGVIFLILIINTMAIMSIASTIYGQDPALRMSQNSGSLSPVSSVSPESTRAATTPQIPATPASTPATPASPASKTASTPLPTPAKNPNPIYVTYETPLPIPTEETHPNIQPGIPDKTYKDFITIYSINNQTLTEGFQNISFHLFNPPLVIEYSVTPTNITDIKNIEEKRGSTWYNETFHINRYYEGTWFTVVVRDKDTGEIYAEDGVGKTWSMVSPKELIIQKAGNYQFEFDGEFGYVTVTMKVKKEGNIP